MRAGGETAALVLTAGVSTYWLTSLHAPAPALAPFIFDALTVYGGSSNYVADAWGAALVLLFMMAAASVGARLLLGRGGEGEAS
jgi:ABC-type phosphate transport system permease subunit